MTLPILQPKTCGECTMCCKIMGVPALDKAPGAWCGSCAIGSGCTRYKTRPQSCKDFACLWLQDKDMPEAYRPDKDYKSGRIGDLLRKLTARELLVFIAHGQTRRMLSNEETERCS